jgi:hypothetical protein
LTIIVVMGWRGMFIGCSLGRSILRIRVLPNLQTSFFEMLSHAEAMRDGCQSNSTNISELKTTTQGDSLAGAGKKLLHNQVPQRVVGERLVVKWLFGTDGRRIKIIGDYNSETTPRRLVFGRIATRGKTLEGRSSDGQLAGATSA